MNREDLILLSDAIKAILYTHLDSLTPEERRWHIESIPAVEPCKDAISREWMMNELEEMNVANFYEANFHSNEVYRDMKQMIKDAPPVTVEPKQGKWIKDKGQDVLLKAFIDKGEEWRVCSVCGAGHKIGERTNGHYHAYFHNYCPNCGATMEGVEDEID